MLDDAEKRNILFVCLKLELTSKGMLTSPGRRKARCRSQPRAARAY